MENNLPKGWIETSLEDLLDSLESGSRPKGGVRGISDGIPSIGGEHLNYDGGFDFTNIKYVPTQFASQMNKGQIELEDILIVKDGATTGKTSFVNDKFPFSNAVVNEHVFICRPSKEINSKYLFWYLWSDEGNKRILENFKGSAQGGINKTFAPNTAIPLPPLPEQQRIVERLDVLMARINNSKARLEKIPALVKNFRQSVLAAAVSGELTKEWREENKNVENADALIKRFEEYRKNFYNEVLNRAKKLKLSKPVLPRALKEDFNFQITSTSELPDSWQWTVIDKIGVVALGGTPSRKINSYWNGNINWVSSGEVTNNRISDTIEKITPEGLANSNAKVYPKGTVLLAMIGEGKTRGQSSILDEPSSTNQNVAAIILNNDFFHSEYVWYYLQSIYENIRKDGSGGAQQALNGFLVGQINIAIPPLNEQKEIVRKVEELFHFAESIEARYQKAKAWFDKLPQSILAKAFRGELVAQDENDEPASELLKRIQEEKHAISKQPKSTALKAKRRKSYTIDEDEELRMVAEG